MISENFLILKGYKRTHRFLGNFSVVNVYETGDKAYAVKKPKNEQMIIPWRESAQKEYAMQKILRKLHTPVQTAEIESFQDNTLIENYLPGQPLTNLLYASLPKQEQNQIARDIAVFLNTLHQFHLETIENKVPVTPEPLGYASGAIIRYAIGNKDWDLFQSNMHHIYDTKHLGKHIAYTHQDLRPGNVLYDMNTKRVKIIDFGEAGNDKDLYYDFAPTISKAGLLPWELTQKIIKIYNSLDKKVPVRIDMELVRDLQIQQILKLFECKIFESNLELPRVSYTASGTSFNTYQGNVHIGNIPEQTAQQASEFYENEFKPLINERWGNRIGICKTHNLQQNIIQRYKSYVRIHE